MDRGNLLIRLIQEIPRSAQFLSSSIGWIIDEIRSRKIREISHTLRKIQGEINVFPNKEIDVLTISANNFDQFIRVDRICPEHESEVNDNMFSCAGGSGANTVCGLSRLGKKTAVVGCISSDSEGEKIIQSFSEFRVNTKSLVINNDSTYPDGTGRTIILVERSGRRQILVTPGINNYLSSILEADRTRLQALVEKVRKSKIIHLSSFIGREERNLQLTILMRIRGSNTVVSLTPGNLYVSQGLSELRGILEHTNLIFLYAKQLDQLLEDSREIREFRKNLSLEKKIILFFKWRTARRMTHPIILVIKNSFLIRSNRIYKNYISVASSVEERRSISGYQTITFSYISDVAVVDTTGTGDALAAGFLYGILEGEDIEKCAQIGFIMATQVSTSLGARQNFPDETSLREILNNS